MTKTKDSASPRTNTDAQKIMQIKPVVTEKAVMLIESQNVLTFKADLNTTKDEIKKEVEGIFDVKIDKIRTMSRDGKKYAYIKLKKEFPAIDVATKLGLI